MGHVGKKYNGVSLGKGRLKSVAEAAVGQRERSVGVREEEEEEEEEEERAGRSGTGSVC